MGKLISIEEINDRMPEKSLLTAIEYPEGRYVSSGGHIQRMVKCKCECGGERLCVVGDLLRGIPLSCGCLKRGRKEGTVIKKKKVKKLNRTKRKNGVKLKPVTVGGKKVTLKDFEDVTKPKKVAPKPASAKPATVAIKKENHGSNYLETRRKLKLGGK